MAGAVHGTGDVFVSMNGDWYALVCETTTTTKIDTWGEITAAGKTWSELAQQTWAEIRTDGVTP